MRPAEDSFTDRVRLWLKHGLAMFLFLGILIGGGTAAFSLLAASIATLSNLSTTSHTVSINAVSLNNSAVSSNSTGQNVVTTWTPGASAPATPPPSQVTGSTSEAAWSGTNQTTGQSVIDQLNNQVDHMHSPLMGVVDSGGAAVGDRVQAAFGHVLAGFVRALFLEQN